MMDLLNILFYLNKHNVPLTISDRYYLHKRQAGTSIRKYRPDIILKQKVHELEYIYITKLKGRFAPIFYFIDIKDFRSS